MITDKNVNMSDGIEDDDRERLRFVTWNVHGSARPDTNELARSLAELDADIIGVQEIRRHQARAVARSLDMHCIWTFKHNPFSRAWPRAAEGLAIMSRWPLEHDGHSELSAKRSHRDHRRRIAMWATVDHPREPFVVANTHLASHDDSADRLAQAGALADLVTNGFPCHEHSSHADTDMVLTGDFNDQNEPFLIDIISANSLKDAWGEALNRSRHGLTSPTSSPHQRLDHVLLPRHWQIELASVPDTSVSWSRLSDHLPVLVVAQMRSK